MDKDVQRRLEALEAEVARLRVQLDAVAPAPAWGPPQPAQPSGFIETPDVEKPAWQEGSATANRPDLESRIGGKWLAIAGITLLVVAIAFFFDLAVDRGWIGLAAQVALGAALGLLLWGGGIFMASRDRLTGFAQVVAAGGVAIAAFSVFVAHHFDTYQAATGISLFVDSVLLGLLGVGAAVDAGLRRVPVQAGTATALVAWTALAGLDATIFSLGYTVFMVSALLAVGLWRGWPWMAAPAAPAALLILSVHLVADTDPRWVFASAALVHALVLGAATRMRTIDAGTVIGHIFGWLGMWIVAGIALTEATDAQSMAWWGLAVGAVGLTAAALLRPAWLRMVALVVGCLSAISAPLFLDAATLRIPLWLMMFAAAEVVVRSKKWDAGTIVRPVLLAAVLIHGLVHEMDLIDARETGWPLALMWLGLGIAGAGVAWQGRPSKALEQGIPLLALGGLLLLGTLEAVLDGVAVSVSWAVAAISLLVVGFLLDQVQLRFAALGIFAAVLGRVVLIDLAGVDPVWRVLAFIGIAATLLLGSWLYVKNADGN